MRPSHFCKDFERARGFRRFRRKREQGALHVANAQALHVGLQPRHARNCPVAARRELLADATLPEAVEPIVAEKYGAFAISHRLVVGAAHVVAGRIFAPRQLVARRHAVPAHVVEPTGQRQRTETGFATRHLRRQNPTTVSASA